MQTPPAPHGLALQKLTTLRKCYNLFTVKKKLKEVIFTLIASGAGVAGRAGTSVVYVVWLWRAWAAVEAWIRAADCREGGTGGTKISRRTSTLNIGGIGATAGSAVQTWIGHSAQIKSRAAGASTKQCHTVVAWTCAGEIACQVNTGASIQTRITCAIVYNCAAVNTFFKTWRLNKYY